MVNVGYYKLDVFERLDWYLREDMISSYKLDKVKMVRLVRFRFFCVGYGWDS